MTPWSRRSQQGLASWMHRTPPSLRFCGSTTASFVRPHARAPRSPHHRSAGRSLPGSKDSRRRRRTISSYAFSATARTPLPSCATGSSPIIASSRAPPREARSAERFGTWSRDVDALEGLEIIVAKRATNKKRNAVPNDLTRLEAMAEEATVDAYGESEQICGWACMFEDHVGVPFET